MLYHASFAGSAMSATAPSKEVETETKERHVPLYHVILHDDDQHSYEYVIVMLVKLFGKTMESAMNHALDVDSTGITIVETCPLERAELKRDQILAFGADPLIATSSGSMVATIEPDD